MQPTLDKYLKALTRLKRGNTPMGIAPHKPVLLVSIIELLEKGIITQNKVYINADLVGTFKEKGSYWYIPCTSPILPSPSTTCKATRR
jgi:putative restriction endonuclease